MKALITGASSGIGKEIARVLAAMGYDLIVAARSYDKLMELKAELKNVNVRVITIDLSREQDAIDLYEHLRDEDVDFLVNNAGFGAYGRFLDVPLKKELDLIHTNVSAVHILTKCYLQDMVKKDRGYILNVGSSAGFLAGPTFSSYYASKNYVVRLTEAVYEELRRQGSNVKISVLCPGPVNTNFNDVAEEQFCLKGLPADFVAKYAVEKTMKGKMVIIPGFTMKAAKVAQHFASENMLTRISYNVQSRKEKKLSESSQKSFYKAEHA